MLLDVLPILNPSCFFASEPSASATKLVAEAEIQLVVAEAEIRLEALA